MENGKRKIDTRINQQQFFQLCQWLMANKERFLKDRPKLSEVSALASVHMRTPIATNTIASAKETTGIQWVAPHAPSDGVGRMNGMKRARIELLESVCATVVSLCTDLGKPPVDLIAKIRAVEEARK